MSFIWPWMLLFLGALPLGVFWYAQRRARRRALVARYGSMGLVQGPAGHALGMRRHLPPLVFLLALAVLIFGLARPVTILSLPQLEGTIILAFDVSASMKAEDLEPSRLEAAKAAARDFVAGQPRTVQMGVVSFSDSSLPGQAPTRDESAVLAAINRLAPQRGTSLGNGILVAMRALEPEPPTRFYTNATATSAPTPTPMPRGAYTNAAIVLLTDGENNVDPDPLIVAQAAADRGIRIHTVGIGSPAGTDIEVDGFILHTQLDEALLRQIADMTGGQYFNAASAAELRAVYDALNTQLVIKTQETEVTAIFTGLGMMTLLLGGALSMLWFGRLP
ncbi:MAG: VWA domain-containing protein [Anaerolineae bacterium]|nr:VWA domain-containing protein [Anaerolineae bacterium]